MERFVITWTLVLLAACGGASGSTAPEVAADAPAPEAADAPDAGPDEGPPPPSCPARAHGAVGDGVTLDTAALQAALDACAGTGGAVVLEAGTYLSGSLLLKGGLTFRLEAGATLLGSPREADYPLGHLLYSEGADDLVLEGPGTIDGNGKPWWLIHSIDADAFRPHPMIRLVDGRGVVVRDVTLKDSPAGTCTCWPWTTCSSRA